MAKSFCKAQVLGSVGADPAITTLGSSRLMASIHIAVAVTVFDATVSQNVERIVWHRIVGFGFHAENIRDNITKGCRVYAEGVPFPYTWEDQGGKMKSCNQIVVSKLIVIQTPQRTLRATTELSPVEPPILPTADATPDMDPEFDDLPL